MPRIQMLYIVLIAILIIYLIYWLSLERFSSKREKADKIVDWFQNNDNPKYSNYRDSVGKTDIVEYTAAKKLFYSGKLNPENLENKL